MLDDEKPKTTDQTPDNTNTALAPVKNNDLAPVKENGNPFTEHADAALTGSIDGTLLKFVKGDYFAGAGTDSRQIAVGTRLIANLDSFKIGWIRWSNGKPVEKRMGRIVDRFKPAERSDLGYDDKSLWEVSDKGEPKDPWEETSELVLANPETREVFTFSTATYGGRKALNHLCKKYGRELARQPDEWPVIELGVDSYLHPDKSRGRIKEPILTTIVGWIPKNADGPVVLTPAPAPKPEWVTITNPLADDVLPYETGEPDYEPF